MSHVTIVDFECNDLESLVKAAKQLGLEFKKDQKTYRWYGRHMKDYPLPPGFSESDMGKCDHALSIPGNNNAYEVGVVKRRDGKPGYQLLWDFWAGGYGLQNAIGVDGKKLKVEYQVALAIKHQAAKGFSSQRMEDSKGNVYVRGIGRGAY